MKLEEVQRRCRERGLLVREVEERGVVLVLHPVVGSELPPRESLQELSRELAGEGVRYVTLGLDAWVEEKVEESGR